MIEDWADIQRVVDEAKGFPFMCAVCLAGMPSRDAKTKHMEDVHGYETLNVPYLEKAE